MTHPIQRRQLAERLVRLRRADEEERYASSQRQGRIDPNPHQIDAVIFALKRIPEGGCILADEVGLGKTIEAGLTIAQLRAEGAARRVLLIVPKPLLGQWLDELYRLFGIQGTEGRMQPGGFDGDGVFLVGREIAGSERGAATLSAAAQFDLCVIDEAHEIFANIYRRHDRFGIERTDSPEARIASRVRLFLRQSPVLLLTATPIQNNLTELWGLVQYVEPTGTLLGALQTFRNVFCDGDDRQLAEGQDDELRRRIETVVQRTLRRQAQEFMEQPFVGRRAQVFEYFMTPEERSLYDDVTAYLLEPRLFAFQGSQRQLLLIGFHRLMGSSIRALAVSLGKVAGRLSSILKGLPPGETILEDLETDEDIALDTSAAGETPDPVLVRKELERVGDFISRASALSGDSKASKLLDVIRVISEREPDRRKAVIFTESLVTQDYLREILLNSGEFTADEVTLFRGENDSPRATEALGRWQTEVGDNLPPYQKPSRTVAVRLALVHEFKTRSRIFISTEAGAKGLNLQFCDTIINYDLPWNPQRIEQRIGRCHRYGQQHDVTVVNFLAADNEAQKLTFEILSNKLDLFGRVLDASDVVLHEPSTDAPETLAGALGADFETRLRRIYERARTLDEITSELRRLREEIGEQRRTYEQTWARTAGLIETRFDSRVKQVFRRLQSDLPRGLARLDGEMDRLTAAFLRARGVPFRRTASGGYIRYRLSASEELPDGWKQGGTAVIGRARDIADGDPLHIGHPLIQAAVEEARAATDRRLSVAWKVGKGAPETLTGLKGRRGRLAFSRIRYDGFERVDRLVTTAVMEYGTVLEDEFAAWLLEQPPEDREPGAAAHTLEADLDDAIEASIFRDQTEVAAYEQQRFERSIEQIDRYVEDQLMVLKKRRHEQMEVMSAAEARRDAALGSEARTQAEERMGAVQSEIDKTEAEIRRLEDREDQKYREWRDRAHERRYRPPELARLLDVEFVLE